jgi:hypothetical protein
MIHSFNGQVLNKAHVEVVVSPKSSPPKASPFVFTTKEKVMASVKPSRPPRREMNKSARTTEKVVATRRKAKFFWRSGKASTTVDAAPTTGSIFK